MVYMASCYSLTYILIRLSAHIVGRSRLMPIFMFVKVNLGISMPVMNIEKRKINFLLNFLTVPSIGAD